MMSDPNDRLRAALGAARPPAAWPAAEIEDRIRGTIAWRHRRVMGLPASSILRSGTVRALLAAAASLAVFIGGAEYGRRLGASQAPPIAEAAGPAVPVENVSLPLSIQSAGSRYVASLARFSETAPSLSPEQRQTAREVALALLYSATIELVRESRDDDILRTVSQLVEERRNEIPGAASGRHF